MILNYALRVIMRWKSDEWRKCCAGEERKFPGGVNNANREAAVAPNEMNSLRVKWQSPAKHEWLHCMQICFSRLSCVSLEVAIVRLEITTTSKLTRNMSLISYETSSPSVHENLLSWKLSQIIRRDVEKFPSYDDACRRQCFNLRVLTYSRITNKKWVGIKAIFCLDSINATSSFMLHKTWEVCQVPGMTLPIDEPTQVF